MLGRRCLLIYFAVLAVLAALSLSQTAVMAAMQWGLGRLLIGADTLLLYSLAALPILLAWKRADAPRWLVPVACIPLAVLVFVPGYLAMRHMPEIATGWQALDEERATLIRPTVIEISDDARYAAWSTDPLVRLPCLTTCLRLLYGKQVERVRLVGLPTPALNADKSTTATYRVERRAPPCPYDLPQAQTAEPAVRARIAAGECLIVATDDATQAQATLAITTLYARDSWKGIAPASSAWAELVAVRRLTVTETGADGRAQLNLVRTQTTLAPIAIPFGVAWAGPFAPFTLAPARRPRTLNEIDLAGVLRQRYGFSLAPVASSP